MDKPEYGIWLVFRIAGGREREREEWEVRTDQYDDVVRTLPAIVVCGYSNIQVS